MRRRDFIARALAALASATAGAGTGDVLLVVQASSPVTGLSALEVRRLFLGLPVLVAGMPLHPLRNRSDPRLDAIFLQHIVALSAEAYDRQLLTGLNRQGRVPPLDVRSAGKIRELLASDRFAVSFLWRSDVEADRQLRTVRVLWQE